jgi:uncharacterized damage-inducible protein DinB
MITKLAKPEHAKGENMAASEIARIQSQLQRAYAGEAWHGPDLRKLLDDVSAEKAAAKPIAAAHSIWVLVLHIIAWQRFVARRLKGEVVNDVPEAENFPTILDRSEAAWKNAKDELEESHQQLKSTIGTITDERLNEIVPGQRYNIYFMLHGVIQHNLYHAGQIAILKKG